MSKNIYKIEKKPNLWEVVCEQGYYLDYDDFSIFFKANSYKEVWSFMKIYWNEECNKNSKKSLLTKYDYPPLRLMRNKEIIDFYPDLYRKNEDSENNDFDYYGYRVTIKPIQVVKFIK